MGSGRTAVRRNKKTPVRQNFPDCGQCRCVRLRALRPRIDVLWIETASPAPSSPRAIPAPAPSARLRQRTSGDGAERARSHCRDKVRFGGPGKLKKRCKRAAEVRRRAPQSVHDSRLLLPLHCSVPLVRLAWTPACTRRPLVPPNRGSAGGPRARGGGGPRARGAARAPHPCAAAGDAVAPAERRRSRPPVGVSPPPAPRPPPPAGCAARRALLRVRPRRERHPGLGRSAGRAQTRWGAGWRPPPPPQRPSVRLRGLLTRSATPARLPRRTRPAPPGGGRHPRRRVRGQRPSERGSRAVQQPQAGRGGPGPSAT